MKAPPFITSPTILACAATAAQPVVSNNYQNPAGAPPLAGKPITLSRIGADGHFTKGFRRVITKS